MLKDQIQSDLKTAMLAHDEARVSALRMLISAVRYSQTGREEDISDTDVIAVIQKELKKRREAAESFRTGGRDELAQKEEAEAQILMGYLPEQMSDQELTEIVEGAITEVGASSMTDMGKVMGMIMPKVSGKAEPSRVSALVKEKLS
jgi:uncharacterized protein YqeY